MTETIGQYLIRRLAEAGVGHVFGVPGDYVLTFFSQLEKGPLTVINTSDEQGAGFAADAYARVNGLGAVCITYCVGGLKVANAVAQAYAEKSPVVVISGAPGVREQHRDALLHHMVRGFDTQLRVFEQLTVATAVLDNPDTAAAEIDRVLAAAHRLSRPVYIELPRDMANAPIRPAGSPAESGDTSDPDALAAALADAIAAITASRHPVILAGEELHRFRLGDELLTFARKAGIPVAATILGKSVYPESDPLYLGVYEGAMGRDSVRDYVERSDCTILLGAMMTDMNLGIYTARIDRRHGIYAARDRVAVGFHAYDGVRMEDFVRGLAANDWPKREAAVPEREARRAAVTPGRGKMSVAALFAQVDAFLENDDVVIADPGDALFGAADLHIERGVHFLGPAYYCSLGFAVPAVLGVSAARPSLRPIVLVGDGAFQMSGMELGTIARYGMNPIVIVLDNEGYGTERPMLDGRFNDVHPWAFWRIPEVLGAGLGIPVETEEEMADALARARTNTGAFTLIQVKLPRNDHSPALGRLTASLADRVGKSKA
jgi:indolepyruvate decarboxylase